MIKKNSYKVLIETNPLFLSFAVLLLRWILGTILFLAGSGKVLGWFGGQGTSATVQGYGKAGIAPLFAYASMFTEFIGGFLLIIGFLTRFAGFAVMINMLVATIITMPHGFLAGMAAYPFSLMITAVAIQLIGPMQFSLDYIILQSRDGGKQKAQSFKNKR
jgi:putative oxidoreductase